MREKEDVLCDELLDIRGRGAMMAIELVDADGRPDAALTGRVAKHCHNAGVIVLTCGTDGNVIRRPPPMSISSERYHWGVNWMLNRTLEGYVAFFAILYGMNLFLMMQA